MRYHQVHPFQYHLTKAQFQFQLQHAMKTKCMLAEKQVRIEHFMGVHSELMVFISANNGQLNKLAEGGTCQPKNYVQFTHICTVSHYLPQVDYCCCQHEQRVLCCRYHHDWDVYRCSQGEDTVGTV
jgi:hypothetical protein